MVLSDRPIYRYHANQSGTDRCLRHSLSRARLRESTPRTTRPVFHDKTIYDKYLQK